MGTDRRREEGEEMNGISICGLVVTTVGVMSLIASSSTSLKGDPEYTYKAGIALTCAGLIMISLGERFI